MTGEEYLPPIVTKLKGDASDLLAAFGEAEAAAKAFGKTTSRTSTGVDKDTDRMGKDVDDFSRLVTKRMKAGETAMQAVTRESGRLRASITNMRKALGHGDDETLFKNIRDAQDDLRKLNRISDTLTPSLEGLGGAAAGAGRAFSAGGAGVLVLVAALILLAPAAVAVVAALADLVGFAVLIPAGLAVLVAAVVPAVVAFRNFGDAISAISSGDIDKINEALKKLSPSARSVAREFQHVLPQLRGLQKIAQEAFFQPLRGDLTLLVHNLLPALRRGFGNVASALGEIVDKFLVWMSQPKQVAGLNKLFDATARTLRNLMDVGPQLFTGIGKAVLAMLPAVEGIAKWFGTAAEKFGDWLGKAASSGQLQSWLDDAMATLGELWDLTKSIGGLLSTVFGSLDDSGRDFIGTLTDMVTKLDEFFESDEGQKALADTAAAARDLADGLMATVGAYVAISKFGEKVMAFYKSVPGAIGDAFAWLGDRISEWWDTLSGWSADLRSKVGDVVDSVIEWFTGLPDKIGAFLSALPGRVSAFFSDAAHAAVYWAGFLVGSVVRFFAELPGKVAAWVTRTWDDVKTKTVAGVNAVISFVQSLPERASKAFSDLRASAVAWFQRTKDDTVSRTRSAVDAVIAWLRGLPGRAVAEFRAFKDRAVDFFKGAKTWLYESGKDLARGVVDGVKSMAGWAIGKIKDFAHDLKQGFKDALGISSPSKAFAEAGEWSAIGVLKGWDRRIGDVRAAMQRSAASLVGGVVTVTSAPAAQSLTAPPPRSGGGDGPAIEVPLYLDGREFARASTTPVQRIGGRNGVTGFGGVPAGYAVAR